MRSSLSLLTPPGGCSCSGLGPAAARPRSSRRALSCRAEFQGPSNPGPRAATEREPWRSASPYDYPPPPSGPRSPPPPPPQPPAPGKLDGLTKALIAAAFVTGLGAGVYFDSEITLSPSNVASTELVDRRTPNSEICMAYGYSAMVFDQRLFVSFNP